MDLHSFQNALQISGKGHTGLKAFMKLCGYMYFLETYTYMYSAFNSIVEGLESSQGFLDLVLVDFQAERSRFSCLQGVVCRHIGSSCRACKHACLGGGCV